MVGRSAGSCGRFDSNREAMMAKKVRVGRLGNWYPEWDGSNLWGDDGITSLGRAENELVATERILRYELGSLLPCSGCGTEIHKADVALSHFAGRYCVKCAEEYKSTHSGNCGICGAPRWRCCC